MNGEYDEFLGWIDGENWQPMFVKPKLACMVIWSFTALIYEVGLDLNDREIQRLKRVLKSRFKKKVVLFEK